MTTTISVQGRVFVIPNDKVQNIVSLLEAYRITENKQEQVKEVLTGHPLNDGRMLING